MTREQVEDFELLAGRLSGLSSEIQALAKKNPNDTLSKFKVGIVNGVLKRINIILGADRLPVEGFTLFDVDAMASASDVLLVLSQYAEAMEHMRAANISLVTFDNWKWMIDGQVSDVHTKGPKKLA